LIQVDYNDIPITELMVDANDDNVNTLFISIKLSDDVIENRRINTTMTKLKEQLVE